MERVWAKCALVSKAFLHQAREVLYRDVAFEFNERHEDPPPRTASLNPQSQALFNTLIAAPSLAESIRELTFVGFGLTDAATFEDLLETVLGMCRALKSLSFLLPMEPVWIDPSRSPMLAGLVRRFAATLRQLHLPDHYILPEDLFPLLSSLTSLTSLDVPSLGTVVAGEHEIPLPTFRLQRLSTYAPVDSAVLEKILRTSQSSLTELVCDWVFKGQTFDFSPFVALRNLHVNIPWSDRKQIPQLLDTVRGCPNLLELYIALQGSDSVHDLGDTVVAIDEFRPFHRLPSTLQGVTIDRSLCIGTPYLVEFLADHNCLPKLEYLQIESEIAGPNGNRAPRSEEEMMEIKEAERTSGINMCKFDADDWFESWSDSEGMSDWEDDSEGDGLKEVDDSLSCRD